MLADDAIRLILEAESTPEDACNALIAAANDAGGRDNTTVIAIDIDGRSRADPRVESETRERNRERKAKKP